MGDRCGPRATLQASPPTVQRHVKPAVAALSTSLLRVRAQTAVMTATAPFVLPPPPPLQGDWALFLDIDGCLLDFADRPEQVIVPPGLHDDLRRLRDALGGALALVSGRSLAQIDALFPEMQLQAAGLHGLQLRAELTGDAEPAANLDALARVRAAAEQAVTEHPGAWVEDKGIALAFHWRAAPAARRALEAIAASATSQLAGYRQQHGNCVLELRPDGHHKGTAIERLMQTVPFAGRTPVYAGDDFTDEDGFVTITPLDGRSIIVGSRRPTTARHAIADTGALRDWLSEGARRLGAAA
jgi:trehalose 6-phosphate phosphatase